VLSLYEVWRLWVKGYLSYWAETDFTLRVTVTLTFDLLTTKSIGVFCSISAITLWSLKALGQSILELLSGNGFHSSGHCDLDLWPIDPKINMGLLIWSVITLWSLKALGQRVLELLSGNEVWQTNRRTRQKQYVSPRGGGDINTNKNGFVSKTKKQPTNCRKPHFGKIHRVLSVGRYLSGADTAGFYFIFG